MEGGSECQKLKLTLLQHKKHSKTQISVSILHQKLVNKKPRNLYMALYSH